MTDFDLWDIYDSIKNELNNINQEKKNSMSMWFK